MAGLEMERQAIIDALGKTSGWAEKVKDMSDKQVLAIYLRCKREGKIKK